MNLLLHICCGPCTIYPFQELQNRNIQTHGFFYNPNIHPFAEYLRRQKALQSLANEMKLEVEYGKYEPRAYFQQAGSFRDDKKQRCQACWQMRLRKTAEFAREKGFDGFSTTLLVSPHQDHQDIKAIGEGLAQELGVEFFYDNFRKGFASAQKAAKEQGLYRQRYCGCIYSKK